MFLLVTSDRPGRTKAIISGDNLCIEWDSTLKNPPWAELYMPEYDREFREAFEEWAASRTQSKRRSRKVLPWTKP